MRKIFVVSFFVLITLQLIQANSPNPDWRKNDLTVDAYFKHFEKGSTEKMPVTVDPEDESEAKNPNPFNMFVLFYDEKLLEIYPEDKLRLFLENHGEIAKIHALFLLARKGDEKAIQQVKSSANSSKNHYVRVYAEKLGFIKAPERDRLYTSQPSSLEAFFQRFSKGVSQEIPETKNYERDNLKDPINASVIYWSKKDLAQYPDSKFREYLNGYGEVARLHAIFLLARKGDEQAIKEVKQLALNSKNGFVRMYAIEILGDLRKRDDPEIVTILKKALDDRFTYLAPNSDIVLGIDAIPALRKYGIKAIKSDEKWKFEEMTEQKKTEWNKKTTE